ncbi:MAG: hypothetical protein HZB14_08105 [Actinobacteria bacterium]|nr:hypothetical protein [Actinomycetota bacterium]
MPARAARPFNPRGLRAVLLPFTHFRSLDAARRTALAGAIAVGVGAVSGIPDFGWIEASLLLIAVSVVRVLARQLESDPFPLPFHDGTLVAAGGLWGAVVVLINSFDGADLGTVLIVLGGCVALTLAGLRVRARGDHYWFE